MSELANKLKSSLSYSFLDKYIGYILRFVSTIIVARLLTPEEVGIYSVAFVLISIGHVLRDFGVAQYLIQQKELNEQKIRAAFATMFFIAWSLWLVLYLCKNQFAQFYHEPRLNDALAVLTIIFLLAPFGSVRIALLRRGMHFKTLAKINVFSYISLFIATLVLCFSGYSFMSLVWGQLVGVIATIIGCVLACGKKYWYWPSLKGMKHVFAFGISITAANIAENTAEGAPDLFIGKLLNMESVGIFSRAQGCVSLFKIFVSASVWPVILPYFSMKNREDGNILPDYLKAIEIYTAFAWPFFICLMLLAEPIVLLLYGTQWASSIPLVKVLSLAAIFEASFPFRNPLLVAMGHTTLNLHMQLIVSGLRVVAICLGCFYGLFYAAIGLVLAEFVSQFYIYYGLKKVLPLQLYQWYQHVRSSIILSVSLGGMSLVFVWIGKMYNLPYWFIIALSLIVGFGGWVYSLSFLKHPIYKQITTVILKIKSKKHKLSEGAV